MSKLICTRWAFDLSLWKPNLPQLIVAVTAIQPEERDRLKKFHFIDDFLSSLIGRLLMRKYVADNTDIKYDEIKFARDIKGKPYLTNFSKSNNNKYPLCFNVSHQGDLVILAGVFHLNINDIKPMDFGIGADVMKIEYSGGKALKEFFHLMHSKFSDLEWSYILHPHHNSQDNLKAFMRNWCLKEAFVKELGVGITIDLQKISFNLVSKDSLDLNESTSPLTSSTLTFQGSSMPNWHFEEHLLKPQYCAAIACKNFTPDPNKFEFLSIQDLLITNNKANRIEDPLIVEYCQEVLSKPRK